MVCVRVETVRRTDDRQPSFVECRPTDVADRVWSVEALAPVVASGFREPGSRYRRPQSPGRGRPERNRSSNWWIKPYCVGE